MKKLSFLFTLLLMGTLGLQAQSNDKANYWQLGPADAITWQWDGRAHNDHIEMSGKRMSVVMRYGINAQGNFSCNFGMVWPMLRTVPNNTHASLQRHISWEPLEAVTVNQRSLNAADERTESISLRGLMVVESNFPGLHVRRVLSPSTEMPAVVMHYTLTNRSSRPLNLCIDGQHSSTLTPAAEGVDGSYCIEQLLDGAGKKQLMPNDSVEFSAMIYAHRQGEKVPEWDAKDEIARRKALVDSWMSNLVLATPDPIINRMFAFSKIRSQESIYQTKGGPLHGPGGESYYAAIWANDQAEYANPFFPFTGYDYALQSAMNSYRLFAGYMNKEWKPIPSSIIAEGTDIWNGAGDRGDAAMIAYGAGRVALETDKANAEQLWPLITWCLEYCHRKLNAEGVVQSDCDELENRFPAGKANLCTSSLYYDALISATYLARELKKGSNVERTYARQAKELRAAIDRYFHADMEGFDTYKYYKENTLLRSWICIPLAMGIFDHAQGTIEALFSPKLWTENGLLTQEGDKTFWDRSTLYALRGALMAGETERTLNFLKAYSETRLLGAHVPYAIEAWPEGNQRHLSAESALYARVITEGLFGIRSTGWNTFTVSPRLPKEWPEMTLSHIRLGGGDFTLTVKRDAHGKVIVQRWVDGKLKEQRRGTDHLLFHVR
jgi:hypothetical protein